MEHSTDVLVVGGGCGGCWAALRARSFVPHVTLVEKGVVARSGGAVFCHDVLAPTPEEEMGLWLKEVVEQAEYLSDQQYAQVLLQEEGERIKEMASFGVPFERDAKGEILRSFGRGHKITRVALYDGRKLMEAMKKEVLARGVAVMDRVMVIDLLTSDGLLPTRGRVIGAVGLETRTGELVLFRAKAVVVATGLLSFKLHHSFSDNSTGDGQAMAFRAGAEMAGMEFMFSPSFPGVTKEGRLMGMNLIPFQTQGAYIINRLGQRFMAKYAPDKGERGAGFGLLGQAMAKEVLEGRGPIYYDMRHFTAEDFARLRRILPSRMAVLDGAGIDPGREPIECRPFVRHFGTSVSGGVRINLHGESSVPGLLAAGIAAQFPGCAEFLSGGMIAFCNVFGYRAGERAGKIAGETGPAEPIKAQWHELNDTILAPLNRERGVRPKEVFRRLAKRIVQLRYGIIKDEKSIKEMLAEIEAAEGEDLPRLTAKDPHELVLANEARNFVHLLKPIYLAALERKETRLTHYRLEYPYRDDLDWLKWIVLKREQDGIKMAATEPLPIETYPTKLEKRERVPAAVQFSTTT